MLNKFKLISFSILFIFILSSDVEAEMLVIGVSHKAGSGHKIPSILVHGDKSGYSQILTDNLTYHMYAKMNYPKNTEGPSYGKLFLEGKSIGIDPTTETKTYEISIPYKKPRTYKRGITPIDHCNAWFKGRTGDERAVALKKGTSLHINNGYKATASASYKYRKTKVSFWENKEANAEIEVPVIVRCIGLNAPAPRKKTTTRKHVPDPKVKHYPTITKLTLRAEPGQMELIDGQLCPTKAYLYGYIENHWALDDGSAVFFGPGYISPITKVDLPKQSNRTVKSTYPIKWTGDTESITANVNDNALKSKSFYITLNVSNKENKVIESTGKKTFTVTCKYTKVNPVIKPENQKIKKYVQ